jgi:small subunit ribosomal protein S14
MVNFLNKDKNKRKLYLRSFKKRHDLKQVLKDKTIEPLERYKTQIEFIKLNQNSSKTRLRKRCVLTGRSKGIVSPFNISRIRLRELISNGMVPGVKRSSW